MRDDLHLPDDGGVILRRSGLSDRGDLHAEHASVSIWYQRDTSDVHDNTRDQRG